ncbi:hypothetical protein BH11VER1_BH11VER1_25130 [soil metagenome]
MTPVHLVALLWSDRTTKRMYCCFLIGDQLIRFLRYGLMTPDSLGPVLSNFGIKHLVTQILPHDVLKLGVIGIDAEMTFWK